MGNAYRSEDGYAVLTDNKTWQSGAMWLNDQVAAPFTSKFRYKAGGGNGADGFVFMFGKKPNELGASGGALGFKEGNGYGLEFDSFFNSNQGENSNNKGKHLALIKDRLTSSKQGEIIPSLKVNTTDAVTKKLNDGAWHDVEVRVKKDGIAVFVDNENVMNWYGKIDHTYSGFGFAAATGGYTDYHYIDDVSITQNVQDEKVTLTDDFSTKTNMWTYMGCSNIDSNNQDMLLNKNSSWQSGAAWLNTETSNNFTTKFKYKSGQSSNGVNGDGFTYMFFKKPGELGDNGGSIGFKAGNGYGIEFDSFYNTDGSDGIKENSPHIALIQNNTKKSGGKVLSYTCNADVISKLTDNMWHDVEIDVKSDSVIVYLDGVNIISYSGTLDTTYARTGFSSATGLYNQSNEIDDFSIDINR